MIKNRFVLIDSFALIHRAYHAIPILTTKDGVLVNAVYGFTSAILSAIKNLEPEYLACGMDMPKPTKRHADYAEYKAHRAPLADELKSQIPYVKEVLKVFNIPIIGVQGYEGEDIIATIVAKSKAHASRQMPNDKNMEHVIVTGDMDTLQLVDAQTRVYSMARGVNQAVMYDEKKVIERYGLGPAQFVDFKALKGDQSDNIPGVTGIGEKTACKLKQEYDNLENIYANLEKITGKTQTLLKEQKDQAFMSRKLSKIVNDAPIDFNLESARIHDFDLESVTKLLIKLGFNSLVARLPHSDNKKLEQGKLL